MISIIIPTLNEEKFIEGTLRALASALTLPHETIISDGKSTDRTAEIASRYADRVLVYKGVARQTIAEGKNEGAKAARGDFFVFLDADVRIPDTNVFFSALLMRFERDHELVAVTVALGVEPAYATLADRAIFTLLNSTYFLFNNVLHIGNGSGEFQMIRASAFRRVKGYREDLPAGEDNDIFRRLSRIGKTRFCGDLTVFHSGRRAHKKGWPKVLYSWVKNGLSVFLFNKSAYKEWEKIR